MITRDTHARIYQQDLPRNQLVELKRLASQMNMSDQKLILEAIRKFLGCWSSRFDLNIEKVLLKNGDMRFFLWLPYQILDELERLLKCKEIHIQELARSAIMEYKAQK